MGTAATFTYSLLSFKPISQFGKSIWISLSLTIDYLSEGCKARGEDEKPEACFLSIDYGQAERLEAFNQNFLDCVSNAHNVDHLLT